MKITIQLDTHNREEVAELINYLNSLSSTEKAHSVTETAQKSTKTKKVSPSIPEEKTELPEPSSEEPKSSITLEVLKNSAKSAVERTDRATVKATISEFGAKLSEVKVEDFGKLYKKLQLLGK